MSTEDLFVRKLYDCADRFARGEQIPNLPTTLDQERIKAIAREKADYIEFHERYRMSDYTRKQVAYIREVGRTGKLETKREDEIEEKKIGPPECVTNLETPGHSRRWKLVFKHSSLQEFPMAYFTDDDNDPPKDVGKLILAAYPKTSQPEEPYHWHANMVRTNFIDIFPRWETEWVKM
jgi:hypothetical protein